MQLSFVLFAQCKNSKCFTAAECQKFIPVKFPFVQFVVYVQCFAEFSFTARCKFEEIFVDFKIEMLTRCVWAAYDYITIDVMIVI
jgi:hypothetical protein